MSRAGELVAGAWAHFQRGDLATAERLCRQALGENPQAAGGWNLLAHLAERAKHPDEALRFAHEAARLEPDQARHQTLLGDLYEGRKEFRRAVECYRAALKLDPRSAAAWNNLAAVLKAAGDIAGAIDATRRALDSDPELWAVRSNLACMLLYDPRPGGAAVLAEHRRLAGWWRNRGRVFTSYPQSPDPHRRLRIGYVSPDLCEHAVMRFFEPILAGHDRQQFEIYLYSECPLVDHVGQRLRAHGDHWRVTWLRAPDDVAGEIRADQIDILVDLAGHTRHNRLDVLALRPAPVQVTYLGYPSRTGLAAIDYRVTDAVLDPPDEEPGPPALGQPGHPGPDPAYGESLVRLAGGYACFRPPDEAPEVAPPPCAATGAVTFASHHPLVKLNAAVFAAWRQILERLPQSRLVMFRSDFVGDIRDRVDTLLDEHGVPRAQVDIRGVEKSPTGYLRTFAEVDLVLDAFPFNGHTMTCESLWMGVPVVTFRGDRPAGRLSSSVMRVLGLPEFVADSVSGYVDLAVRWGQAPQELAALRPKLRGLVAERLGAKNWLPHLETAYRQMWQTWCARHPGER